MPNFFADECVARAIVEGLIQRGLDVVDAKDVCRGDSDERVLALAEAAERVVITHDWGFDEMAIRHRQAAAGVIILSLYGLSAARASVTPLRKWRKSPTKVLAASQSSSLGESAEDR